MMMSLKTWPLLNSTRRAWVMRLLGAIFLLAIATVITLPNYVTGNWIWAHPPRVPHQTQLNALAENGLSLPGWQTLEQSPVEISGHGWSVQAIVPDSVPGSATDGEPPGDIATDESPPDGINITPNTPAILLLRPQTWHRDMPQVEWMDLNGVQNWTVDQRTALTFTVTPAWANSPNGSDTDEARTDHSHTPIHVRTRFFRGWSRQQTYAVMQWYAWPTGGSPAASRWFWADQKTQLSDRHRNPWVAVSLLVPIKPLGDRQTAEDTAQALAQTIHMTLIRDVFSPET